jgi:hypothetical protein
MKNAVHVYFQSLKYQRHSDIMPLIFTQPGLKLKTDDCGTLPETDFNVKTVQKMFYTNLTLIKKF